MTWVIWLTRLLGYLPLPALRGIGAVMGWMLFALAASRRKVVNINLQLCFPHWSDAQRRTCAQRVFVHFAQSWLDRGWLWHARRERVERRLQLSGALEELQGDTPVVLFAPHFMGLDAAWTALNLGVGRSFTTIYATQVNPVSDAWIHAGRTRFGSPQLVARLSGAKPVLHALRGGRPLYLLPDMNYDPKESVFVPFYGVQACTITSLSRFARLGHAKVVPVVARMTPAGYDIRLLSAWSDYPTGDLSADTARMNAELQTYIDAMPDQYYWVHKRFKDRPSGEKPPY